MSDSKTAFRKLFEPGRIGRLELKNRIVMPPMYTSFAGEEGSVSQTLIDYLVARARGGVGLIIVEATAPAAQCRTGRQLSLGDDALVPGWRKLVDEVHRNGARIAVQLQHATFERREGKVVQVAPSAVVVPARLTGFRGQTPHELTVMGIREIEGWFGSAAGRARQAGFDGVEIHGAHQYLIASFLSPATNFRKDEYGGTLENRARLLLEILISVVKEAGPGFPVWVRLNGEEWGVENGATVEETKQVAQMAVKAGAQAIHVSGYGAGVFVTKAPITDTAGILVPVAGELKKSVSVPVIAAGRLDPELGEKVLQEGKSDFISIGRRIIADPELPNKAMEGRFDEVNACIGCMECIERQVSGGVWRDQGMLCTVNPLVRYEGEYGIRPSDNPKKVVVVGGGPAGLVAARVAALRGHSVTLFERSPRLGGQLNIAALPPHKSDILPWMNYLIGQIERTGVKVKLGTEATSSAIGDLKPDAVIVASGGVPLMPPITGIDKPLVVTAQDVLSGKRSCGQRVVIIGGGTVGCETGDYLAAQGKRVHIIEILEKAAADMFTMVRRRLLDGLKRNNVVILTGACCEQIGDDSVIVTRNDGSRETISADTVIVAAGYQASDALSDALRGKVAQVRSIGDASKPQRILEAVQEGFHAGFSI